MSPFRRKVDTSDLRTDIRYPPCYALGCPCFLSIGRRLSKALRCRNLSSEKSALCLQSGGITLRSGSPEEEPDLNR